MTKEQEHFVDQKIDSLLQQKCIVELDSYDKTGFLNNVFLVEKRNKQDFRMILNCKNFNNFLVTPHFKTESIKDVLRLLQKNFFFITVNICDAYQHFRLRSRDFRWFQFKWKKHIMAFSTMPQGMKQLPYEFTRVCRQMVGHLRTHGIFCVIYFDDLIVIAESYEKCQASKTFAIETLQNCGFLINFKKSSLKPS